MSLPRVIMEPVEPWLPAVRPFIQEAIRASGVTSMINTSSNTAAALRDNKVIWLLGGLAVGFYFGFRVGAVSGRSLSPDLLLCWDGIYQFTFKLYKTWLNCSLVLLMYFPSGQEGTWPLKD